MKVIVIVDMQNDFITGPLGTPEAVVAKDNLINWLKNNLSHKDKVIFTMDTHENDYLETQEGKNLPIPHCIVYTNGWKLNKEITDIVDKIRPYQSTLYKQSFGTPFIKDYISYDIDEIEEIIFCGVCTDICVVSNALITKAESPEIPISIIANCCAGTTPEKHKAALSVMESCQIKIVRD